MSDPTDGTAANGIGLAIVTGLIKVKDLWKYINSTRDMLANHIQSGTHTAAQISSGRLDPARLPATFAATSLASGTQTLDTSIPGQWTANGGMGVLGALAANGVVTFPDAYSDVIGGSWHNLFVRSDGRIGYVPSSQRFKKNVKPVPIDEFLGLFELVVVEFDYIKAAGGEHDIGLLAERVAKVFPWAVSHDLDGRVDGIQWQKLIPPLIAIAQYQQKQFARLDARLKKAGI